MAFKNAMERSLKRWQPRTRRKLLVVAERPRTNAFGVNEETAKVLRTITAALRTFPEARAAVVEALQCAEKPS